MSSNKLINHDDKSHLVLWINSIISIKKATLIKYLLLYSSVTTLAKENLSLSRAAELADKVATAKTLNIYTFHENVFFK